MTAVVQATRFAQIPVEASTTVKVVGVFFKTSESILAPPSDAVCTTVASASATVSVTLHYRRWLTVGHITSLLRWVGYYDMCGGDERWCAF